MAVDVHKPPPNDWFIQVPLSQLVALQDMSVELDKVREENKRLIGHIDALHRTQYEMMEVIIELRKRG